jgi:hypothetical protein
MNNKVLHAIDIKRVMAFSAIGVALGAVLLFVPMSTLISLIISLLGLILIVVNGIEVYGYVREQNENSNEMLLSVIGVLSGFILLVASGTVVMILISLYLCFESGLKMYMSKWERQTIINESPRVILAILLILCVIGKFNLLFKVAGGLLAILSVGYLAYNYYLYKKSGIKIIK